VGVLLDEFPAASRDRIAADLLARPEAFWLERARLQLRLTSLRLVYRALFYDEADNKNALTLPPESVWTITPQPAARIMINGHDLVAVDYVLTSALLTDVDSPGISEPALGTVGGAWDEDFVLPVDPTLLLQRTGYACIDEDQFPPESVETENAYNFFDDTCEVETEETRACHHSALPNESCIAALERVTGSVESAVHYERIAWNETRANEVRDGEVTTPGTPDLSVITTGHQSLSNNYIIYRYIPEDHCAVIENCVTGTGWRRLLTFDSIDHNKGGAPLHIGPVDYYVEGLGSELIEHNVYEVSECHEHYHFQYYGDFSFTPGGAPVAKNGFCIESTGRLSNNETAPLHTDYRCDNQGLSAGWVDLYAAGLTCNWIDITDVDTTAGTLIGQLEFHSNPEGFMCEGQLLTDADGGQAWEPTTFRSADGGVVDRPGCEETLGTEANDIGRTGVAVPVAGGIVSSACGNAQQIGPNRNCGFAPVGTQRTCTPGEMVTLMCSGGDADHPQVVRACEGSASVTGVDCTLGDALANTVVAAAAVAITFPCPAARDMTETGGRFGLLSAPAFEPDGPRTVTCTP